MIFLPLPFEIPISFKTYAVPGSGIVTLTIANFIRVIILLFIIPLINPFAKIIAKTLVNLSLERQLPVGNQIRINDSNLGGLIIQGNDSQGAVTVESLSEATKTLTSQERNILSE